MKEIDKEFARPGRNFAKVYRGTMLVFWLGSSSLMILDRFYWNVWPRQTICTNGCGNDFFCDMDDDPGCLKEGPWSVQVFDVIARISARLIISTTSLLFGTMCHGTWNYLSEVSFLRPLLYAWREDNLWLHTVGGWTLGIWVVAHVWSLLLPSITHGFENVVIGGELSWPAQVSLPGGNMDAENRQARWGIDDLWRIFWMTAIFGALMPLSRSAWALKKNFSLSMWLHMALGAGFFFDSWRRRTHPHVWIFNTPVVLWYLADKIWSSTSGRGDPLADATRIKLDDEYMLVLWKHKSSDTPKRICDLFWLKGRGRPGAHASRVGEMAHPFTTCSSHDVTMPKAGNVSAAYGFEVRPTIEPPIKTDVNWPGHRFSLKTVLSRSRLSPAALADPVRASNRSLMSFSGRLATVKESSLQLADPSTGSDTSQSATAEAQAEYLDNFSESESVEGGRALAGGDLPPSFKSLQRDGSTARNRSAAPGFSPMVRGMVNRAGAAGSRSRKASTMDFDSRRDNPLQGHGNLWQGQTYPQSRAAHRGEESKGEQAEEDTMIGVDTGASNDNDDITIVVGTLASWNFKSSKSLADNFFDEDSSGHPESVSTPSTSGTPINSESAQIGPSIKATDSPIHHKKGSSGGSAAVTGAVDETALRRKKNMIKRLSTREFHEFRSMDAVDTLAGGAWDKMAIMRIHRRGEPKQRECSCLGYTHIMSSFRRTETSNIADLEADTEGGGVTLRTYGPYRSGYGRLGEFPDLPPILIIGTGAGAALVLDFVAYVRANNLTPIRPVTVCYSSASLALLQFVTNTLLAERLPGIRIMTALTRHDDLELFDTKAEAKDDLAIGRLDVMSIVNSVSDDTEVYFCGGGGVNVMLRKSCAKRGMKYAGSAVQ